MTEPLFTVESTYTVRGRGLVLVGISTGDQYGSIQINDPLTIRLPNGSILHSAVRGMEYPP